MKVLNVIRSDNRMLLGNGYHRAWVLLAAGVRYAPCVVQTVARRDELAVVAPRRVAEGPAFYLEAGRPPPPKEFFDPRIPRLVRERPIRRVIEASFEVKEYDLDH